MKKHIFKYSLLTLLAAPALTACEMDQLSPDNLSPEEATTSIDDAESWRMGLYSTMRGVYNGANTYLSDLQLDEFVTTSSDGNSYMKTSTWTFENATQDQQVTVWANNYTLIKNANRALEELPAIPSKAAFSKTDSLELDQILGEAHLIRAIAYQTLATYFTDRYDAANAKQQKGLPIVSVVDDDAMPARESLDSTYRFILSDLDAARRLMTNQTYAGNYLHNAAIVDYLLPSSVVDLVEARVRLTIGDYAKAAELAQGLIDSGDYPLITTTDGLVDMWTNDRGSEILFQIYQSADERGANWAAFSGLNLNYSSIIEDNCYVPSFYPTIEAYNLFEAGDIRKAATFFQGWSYAAYMISDNAYVVMLAKYPGNPDLMKAQSDCYNMTKLFRIPEAYLIAAEAYYKNNETGKALTVFNQLHHDARGAAEVTDASDLLTQIGDEYVREYIGEGLAFSAYKRLNRNVVRSSSQQIGAVRQYAGISVVPSDTEKWKRWTWEIPQQDLFANSNLESNW